jgi:flagellar biosynthesis/type III secretory pathway chaperone
MNYAALLDVLRQQAAALLKMRRLLEQGGQALMTNDLYRLDEIEREKILVQQQMQFLEEKRTGLYPAGKTLSAIAEGSPPDYREKLTAVLDALRRLAAEVQEANSLNKMLLQQSLAYVQMMQRVLQPEKGSFYGWGGKLKQESMCQAPLTRLLDETA